MVISLFLVFLFPLAVYLLVLAAINRREKPLLVSGICDALGLTFALAGVYLWIGPAILGTLYERGLLPGADGESNRRFIEIWTYYPYVWAAYYLLVIVGQTSMVLSRSNKTSIYNVDAVGLERLLADCFRRRGYEVSEAGGTLLIRSGESTGAVEIDRFLALRHVTLQWFLSDAELRGRIEADLENRLDEASTPDNPIASWLMGVSGTLFGLVIVGGFFSVLLMRFSIR